MEKAEKISVSDLSIGDWVYHDDIVFGREIAKVHRLNKDKNGETIGITVYRSDGAFGVVGYIWTSPTNNDIYPIPITPEILEKNGFVDNGAGQHYLKCSYGVTVRVGRSPLFHDGCWLVATDNQVDETITTTCVLFNAKHIHELQRVMRLAKVRKEIEV